MSYKFFAEKSWMETITDKYEGKLKQCCNCSLMQNPQRLCIQN